MTERALWSSLIVVVLLLAAPRAAAADPAGPTEYLSEVTRVEPPTDLIAVRMIGGDSFFELELLAGAEVIVIGYQAEPYLRFTPGGLVERNRRSPTTYLNEERYGTGELVPASADPAAAPEWETVATDGRYAWHDHRTHWMNTVRPPGAEPGDQILEAVIPIDVNGERVDITVVSSLQSDPNPLPALLAAVVGIGLGALVLVAPIRASGSIGATVALFALGVGVVAVASVPGETEPSPTLWLPPAIAVASSVALSLRPPSTAPGVAGIGLLGITGVQLLLWAALSRTMVTEPILPTVFPWAGVRAIVVLAAVVGVGASMRFLVALVDVMGTPVPEGSG